MHVGASLISEYYEGTLYKKYKRYKYRFFQDVDRELPSRLTHQWRS